MVYFTGEETDIFDGSASIVSVPRADDETFTSFFSQSSNLDRSETDSVDIIETDFDAVTSSSDL